MALRDLHVFVVAPLIGRDGLCWVATDDGRVIGRYGDQDRAWRAVSGAAYDASIVAEQPARVLLRDQYGRVVRHMELDAAPTLELPVAVETAVP